METNRQSPASDLKAGLRAQIQSAVRAMTPAERALAARHVCEQLPQLPMWHRATSVLFYAPLADELDIWPLLNTAWVGKKTVALPRFVARQNRYEACQLMDLNLDIQHGKFGVREPAAHCPVVPLNQLDLVLVPGVAFALDGHRLGRGKGYYDRLLAEVRGAKCGLAFDQQVVVKIPAEPHDQNVDCLITPTRRLLIGPVAAK